MVKLSGKSVYKGIVLGPIAVLKKDDQQVKRVKITDADAELGRLGKAGEQAKEQLQALYDKALKEVGEASAAIFEVHQMMLEDEDYLESIHNMIRTEMVNAEYAVAITGDNFSEMFAGMDDEYMKARAADVKDISNRLVRNLTGQQDLDLASMEPSIIVADDLSPSETVQMDKSKILAFVTVHGSTNSHTSILARMMNIPALVSVPLNLDEVHTGMKAVVDGFSGEVIFEPSEEICAATEERVREEQEKLQLLHTLKGKENVTLGGRKINIYANIAASAMWAMCWKMMQAGLACSAASSYTLAGMISQQRRNSFQHTGRWCRPWLGKRLLSVRWILGQTSRWIISILGMRITLPWVTVRSVFA